MSKYLQLLLFAVVNTMFLTNVCAQNPEWQLVTELEKKQQYVKALEQVSKIYQVAKQQYRIRQWTLAFIRIVLLQRAVHGYEKAVRFMMTEEWPDEESNRAILHLFYADTLFSYYKRYSWEIDQREQITAIVKLDLKKWSAADIFQEINKQYFFAYQLREELGKVTVYDYAQYIRRGGYPNHICATMRDFLIDKWTRFLANTSTWKPKQLQHKYQLDFATLIATPNQPSKQRITLKTKLHPMLQVVHLLNELYFWHRNTQPESALEVQLKRFRLIEKAFSETRYRKRLLPELGKILKGYQQYPWWAAGQYEYAALVKKTDNLVAAHQLATDGYRRYPLSLGGKKCLHLFKSIEAPSISIRSMGLDRIGTNSIEVRHKNIAKLYFRAYNLDFQKWLARRHHYPGGIYSNDLRKTLANENYQQWSIALVDPGDYKTHKTYVIPQVNASGFYVIAASAIEDFATRNNNIQATYFMVSKLVTIANQIRQGWEVFVVDGSTGDPIPKAQVALYLYNYSVGNKKIRELTTDHRGYVFFPNNNRSQTCFIVAKSNNRFSFNPNGIYFSRPHDSHPHTSGSLLYTDRSIYRPLQTVYFKLVSYLGDNQTGQYRCLPNRKTKVVFYDPNHKIIATKSVKTNSYGTASGEFVIPKGRVLGRYRLSNRIGRYTNNAHFRVEEYKRPTFEVKLGKPDREMRLNRQARLQGQARYYFGLPVSVGKVFYRITRIPQWPWWYHWQYGSHSQERNTYEVGSGTTVVDQKGQFAIVFTPQADEQLPGKDAINYVFRVEAQVTDEGGETRTSTETYHIGFVAVKAKLQLAQGFITAKDDVQLNVMRTDLSGNPLAGIGQYQLLHLKQPTTPLLPSQLPVAAPQGKTTPGDTQRPRWENDKSLRQYLYFFQDGDSVSQGKLQHKSSGKATLALADLAPGAYRIYYRTKDNWNAAYRTQLDFVVAAPDSNLAVPLYLLSKDKHVEVNDNLELCYGSGFREQTYWYEIYQSQKLLQRRLLKNSQGMQMLTMPIAENLRGGFTLRMFTIHDYQLYSKELNIYVPWNNKKLQLEFTSFRDLLRPGQKETWTVSVKGPNSQVVAAEVLAYMYDRSLDYFAPHQYPSLQSLYPKKYGAPRQNSNLNVRGFYTVFSRNWYKLPGAPQYQSDYFFVFDNYPVGGLRMNAPVAESDAARSQFLQRGKLAKKDKRQAEKKPAPQKEALPKPAKQSQVRSNFRETAFFQPHLICDVKGNVQIKFSVPDSITSWKVYLHAITRDLNFMSLQKETVTRKDLMVRPYVPRFFREGDQVRLKVVVNNATDAPLQGKITLDIFDPLTKRSHMGDFAATTTAKFWKALGHGSTNVTWTLTAPRRLGTYAFKVIAATHNLSDGEVRPVPVLPSRIHLSQSKFVALKDTQTRILHIKDLEKAAADSTLIHNSLVVGLDGQLIYTVLKALPYLVHYPYECVEQTLNRFLCTGMVTSLYGRYPAIANVAQQLAKRKTRLDPWTDKNAHRKMALEETPWLIAAEGDDDQQLLNVLDPAIANAQREQALTKLQKAQLSNGAFPWWAGGPPSPYMTLYLMHGFAKAREFEIAIPKPMIQKAWSYLAQHFRDYYEQKLLIKDYGYHFITFLNYVLSCYDDSTYYRQAFTAQQRLAMLEYSFKYWRKHSPYLKAYLALTLARLDRANDALLVLASIMDSAITKQDQGTFWAAEDRAWLWYNDHIESHAFILRALLEIQPHNKEHTDGLILWLLLNKKMNQWKSTRTTAEVIYSLVTAMKHQGALGTRETATVTIGKHRQQFVFEPDQYNGGHYQLVFAPQQIIPETMAKATIAKVGKGYMFASLNWHYSTEQLPSIARGDFLAVTRQYFIRKYQEQQFVLLPLTEDIQIEIGDQVEVHLSIVCKHPMEYIHLRDPRGAGFEPEKQVSGYRWDLGISWYQEVRDSGTNFFFEKLPHGEYSFRYRLRANMAGKFRVGPATLQSMYAPEFTAFSSGKVLVVK